MHKVLGRGRPSAENAPERWRARVLRGRRAAAELCRYAPRMIAVLILMVSALFASAAQPVAKPPVLLHAFVSEGQVVGYLYGYEIPEAKQLVMAAFTRLEIRSSTSSAYRVLYRVERTGTYLASGQLDASIHDDGSRGFYLEVQRPTYVSISCCKIRTPNNGAMDGLQIEWNPEAKRFELLKTP